MKLFSDREISTKQISEDTGKPHDLLIAFCKNFYKNPCYYNAPAFAKTHFKPVTDSNDILLYYIISGVAVATINYDLQLGYTIVANLSDEKEVQEYLSSILQGRREVKIPAGKIDILTKNEIIEVKRFDNNWKHAIGQVMVYGNYFPNHRKRLHVIGFDTVFKFEKLKKLITENCNKLNVRATFQRDVITIGVDALF